MVLFLSKTEKKWNKKKKRTESEVFWISEGSGGCCCRLSIFWHGAKPSTRQRPHSDDGQTKYGHIYGVLYMLIMCSLSVTLLFHSFCVTFVYFLLYSVMCVIERRFCCLLSLSLFFRLCCSTFNFYLYLTQPAQHSYPSLTKSCYFLDTLFVIPSLCNLLWPS